MQTDTFRCPKCGFVQHYAFLCAETGRIGENRKDEAECLCPNDGETLQPVFDESELQ